MQVYFTAQPVTTNPCNKGNLNGGYSYDTSVDDEPRNPAINPGLYEFRTYGKYMKNN